MFVIALMAWLFSEHFAGLEQMLSGLLFDSFAAHKSNIDAFKPVSLDRSAGVLLMRFGVVAGFATCGVIAAYQLSRSLRVILFVQLVALNLVLHVILSLSGETLTMPISLFLASTFGMAFGYLVKQLKDIRQQLLAKDTMIENLGAELLDSSVQLIKDDETERRILAGDLHDQVLNDLKLLRERVSKLSKSQMDSASVEGDQVPDNKPSTENDCPSDSATSEFQAIDQLMVRSMQQVREVMDSLSPAVLQHLGFVDAIEDCVRSGSERADYKVRFRCNIEHSEFDVFKQIEQTLLYRLVQESITNICKHAQASVVKCIITADGDSLIIKIVDDGKGMDPANASSQSRGLEYMRQRARIIGATVNWLPGEDNKGTTVNITIRKPK